MSLSAESVDLVSTHVPQDNTILERLVPIAIQDVHYVTEAYQLALASHQSQQCVLRVKTMVLTITSRWLMPTPVLEHALQDNTQVQFHSNAMFATYPVPLVHLRQQIV